MTTGRGESDTPLCATCGVEAADPLPDVCPICEDERQF
ncbi:hydrolase, partial [Mycoplasma flocculare]|nr:hydrolase [Mesomycoplasma flocculare]